MAKKFIFRGGTVVLPDRQINSSLVVEDGIIKGLLDPGISLSSEYKTIDVSDRFLLPGVIDPHVHMWDPSPMNYREDWYYGTRCAASGGITTVIDMPLSVPPVLNEESFRNKEKIASDKACVDFAFWGGLTPESICNLDKLNEIGCVAYKGFMSYASEDYPQITDEYLVEGMRIAEKFNGLIGVHAENALITEFGSRKLAESNCMDYSMHDDARPWWAEFEAIQRATFFSKLTGARLYICHMTTTEGAELIKKAKYEGVSVYSETCPHYLIFDKSILNEKGSYAKCNPPMRSRENAEKLWDYVFDGTIDTIGSDHGPYSDAEKIKEGNFFREYCGFGGFDAMLAVLLTEGVHKRDLSLSQLAQITSGNPAEIMGLAPFKGSLLPGTDADIAVVDLSEEWTYDGLTSFSKTKSINSLYHGYEFKGKVKQTWVRGNLIYEDNEIKAPAGSGKLITKNKNYKGDI